MEIKGILFDKDGTLIDFYSVWAKAVNPVMDKILKENGLMEVLGLKKAIFERLGIRANGEIDPEGPLAWMPYDRIAQEIMAVIHRSSVENCQVDTERLKRQLIDGFYREICGSNEKYEVFTDMQELMEQLGRRGISVGLATTDEYDSAKSCMERLGINRWISFYGTPDGALPVKPDGRLVELAAEQWGIQPDEIAVVGDTPNDMRFAANGRALGIGVLSGTGKKEDLGLLADYVIDSVNELIPLLDTIGSLNR